MDHSEDFNERTPKLFVLGWDAATWDILMPWIKVGHLPNLAALMENGVYGSLKSTPLPVSPAAWTTLITGKNPAKHGIYDWFSRKPGSYDVAYVHTGMIRTKSVWDYLNEAGLRVGVFNLPMIYPALKIEGFMISGLAAPNPKADDFAYPRDLMLEIEREIGPFWHAETEVYKYGREQEYLENVIEWTKYQESVLDYLIEHHPCDIYWLVFMQTDHMQHKYWRYMDETYPGYNLQYDAKFKDAILQSYQDLDRMLGKLVSTSDGNSHFLVLSDHGAGPVHGVMYINQWLKELGYLHLKRRVFTQLKFWTARTNIILKMYNFAARLGLGKIANLVSKPARNRVLNSFLSFNDIDWSRTKAYARGAFGQIFINLEGREPQGIIDPGKEYNDLVTELIGGLTALRHPETGEALITDIKQPKDVYSGRYIDQAADIMFSIQNYKYQASVKMGLESSSILGPSEYADSSSHRPEGMFVLCGPGIEQIGKITGVQATDILPTILSLTGVPIPKDLDGEPIHGALTFQTKKGIKWIDREEVSGEKTPEPELNPDEINQIENRLRDLGYLG